MASMNALNAGSLHFMAHSASVVLCRPSAHDFDVTPEGDYFVVLLRQQLWQVSAGGVYHADKVGLALEAVQQDLSLRDRAGGGDRADRFIVTGHARYQGYRLDRDMGGASGSCRGSSMRRTEWGSRL